MNQPKAAGSGSTTDKEMIAMAEEELARLHRQLRIMEDDRVAFSEETSSKLEKQRKIIQTLKNEKQKIVENITVATCANQKKKDEQLTEDICRLVKKYEKYEKNVRNEREQIKELEIQIKKMEDDINSLRPKTVVTEQEYQYRLTSGNKTIKMLQNRLEHSIKKFCSILTENKKLREDIDHLLKEMNHFNVIWEKLLNDMNCGKKFMVDLIEQATLAYDQREEWCSKLEALKKRAQTDFITHSEEMREIQRQLDHYLTLREFLSVKGQRRILKDLEEKERKKKESQIQNLENQLRLYERTLEQIQKFCEEDDIDRIASQFLKQEEENFALFNYVNELNHEIEMLHTNLTELEEKIDEQVQLSQARDKERQANLRSLQYDLDESIKKADEEEENVKQAETVLQDVLKGIEAIFKLLKCDRGPILELLGEHSSINFFNMNIYLGTIEKKITKLITMVYFAEKTMLTQVRKFSQEDFVKLIQ